ncbi:MAG: hypothetical protein ABIF10_05635 [Candidatus Woesearchaeota archaeon]
MGSYDIRDMYRLAVAEGEGYGTAYEYLVKLRLLEQQVGKNIRSVLIIGLPRKYGLGLDLAYYCQKNGCSMTVLEKSEKIGEMRRAAGKAGLIIRLVPERKTYDLCLSSGHYDNLTKNEKKQFLLNAKRAKQLIVFVPNSENTNHRKHTGLKGMTAVCLAKEIRAKQYGWLDIPPFAPGKKLKKQKESGLLLLLLQIWTNIERCLPRKKAHICWAKTP